MIPRKNYEGTEDFGFDIIRRYVIFDNITSTRLSFDLKLSSRKPKYGRIQIQNYSGEYFILYFGSENVSAAREAG